MNIEAYEQLTGALVVDDQDNVSIKIQSSGSEGQWYTLEPVSSNLTWIGSEVDQAALDVALEAYKGGV
tara:strand:- start:3341 stop:3544 length:204 start_codon:yes stop_codon:yes gene_type:complete